MKKLIYFFLLMPFLGISQAKFGGNSVAAARATLKNSSTYTLTYVDGVFYLVSTTSSYPIAFSVVGATGSGNLVYSTSPTLVTPNLGTPSAVTLTNATGLPVSTGISGFGTGIANFLATPSSTNLAAALTDETGTGSVVLSNNSTLTGTTFITGLGAIFPNSNTFDIQANSSATSGIRIGTSSGTSAYLYTNGIDRLTINSAGNVGIGTALPAVILDINSTGAIKIPVGADAQRPASPSTGMLRVNTTASPAKLEYYNGASWIQL